MFGDSTGRPKSLPFANRKRSFSTLVRKYSGDIPARAMLIEMMRLGMVRRKSNDTIYLVRSRPNVSKSTVTALRAIVAWVNAISDCSAHNLRVTSDRSKLYFDSLPQALAAVRELEDRKNSFREAIEQLGNGAASGGKYELKVSIAIATEQAGKITRRPTSKH